MLKRLKLGAGLLAALVAGVLLTPSPVIGQVQQLLYGSASGVAQPIKATSNALWVSIQSLTAGAGTNTFRPAGIIYSTTPNDTNSSTTNYKCLEFTALSGNTLVNVGDQLIIRYEANGTSDTNSKAIRIALGYTSCGNDATGFVGGILIQNSSTSTGTPAIQGEARYWLTSTGHESGQSVQTVSGSGQSTGIVSDTADNTAAIKMGLAYKNTTASALTINHITVEFLPAQ